LSDFKRLNPSERILLGPGPSSVHPRVYQAMSAPVIGHLDPQFIEIMEDNKILLRKTFQTQNWLTIPMSGTGSAGMETCLVNMVEPGDKVLICINGVFGQRMKDVAERCGAQVTTVEAPMGQAIPPEKIKAALDKGTFKLIGIVHAETSTGVLQPLEEISKIVHAHDALFLVDTVTSLGGIEVAVDKWDIDICYSGTQKCLSCPPGLSPVTLNERCLEVVRKRKHKVQSWYLDLGMIEKYWGQERVYHHTAPISMNYALREALILIDEEGLKPRWERHLRNHKALVSGIEAMELKMVVAPEIRCPSLNTVWIPEGINDAEVRRFLLEKFDVEIGAGLGDFKGKAWRIGLMGHSSTRSNVVLLLAALEIALAAQGVRVPPGAGMEAALTAE
jgi:alanine-glyoxylate transaminase/serine-glyoxylate transaminase/serine-pyruvate transaminase